MVAGVNALAVGNAAAFDSAVARGNVASPALLRIEYRFFNPVVLAALSMAIWAVLFTLTPVELPFAPQNDSLWLVGGFGLAFLLGGWLGYRRLRSVRRTVKIRARRLTRITLALLGVGALGFVLRLVDRILIRGATLTMNFVENREAVAEGDTSALSFLASLMVHALFFVPLLVMLRRAGGRRHHYDWLIIAACFTYALSDLLLFGLRYPMLVLAMMTLFSWLTVGNHRMRAWHIVAGTLMLLASTWLMGAIFSLRAEQAGVDPVLSMSRSAYATFLPLSVDGEIFVQTDGTGIAYGAIHVSQYYLHGLLELLYAVENGNNDFSHGAYSFYIPAKVVWTLLGWEPDIDTVVQDAMVRDYVYTTLFGPLYYDFGTTGGIAAAFLMGLGCGLVARRLARQRWNYLPLYVVICALLPFASAVNIYVMLPGQFVLLVAAGLIAVLRWVAAPGSEQAGPNR